MVKPKVEGYHRQPAINTTEIQYNHWNNLPIHSAQLTHAQQWTASAIETFSCEAIKHNNNLTSSRREILQWHFCLSCIRFSHIHFLARNGRLPLKNPKYVVNFDKVNCQYCQFGKASLRPTKTQTIVKYKSK